MTKFSFLTSEFHPFRGGIGVLAGELALAAAELGAEIDVIAPDYMSSDHKAFDDAQPYRVIRYRAGPYSGKKMPLYIREALRVARDQNAGRLVAVDSPFLEALALTRGLHRQPFDALIYGSEINRAKRSKARHLIGLKRLYGRADRYITISRFTHDLLLDHMPFIDPDRVRMTYPAASERWFAAPDPALLSDVVAPGAGPVIVCTGRITPRKGQLTLARALQRAPFDDMTRKTLTVIIAGRASEADRPYLEQLTTEIARAAPLRIEIRDDLDDDTLRALYARADLFCLPGSARTSSVEGFGLVFVEAAAQGLPAVAGAVGAVPEVVLDGETGMLVPPDNPDALGQALAALLSDRTRLDNLRARARAHAQSFSWTRFAQTVLETA